MIFKMARSNFQICVIYLIVSSCSFSLLNTAHQKHLPVRNLRFCPVPRSLGGSFPDTALWWVRGLKQWQQLEFLTSGFEKERWLAKISLKRSGDVAIPNCQVFMESEFFISNRLAISATEVVCNEGSIEFVYGDGERLKIQPPQAVFLPKSLRVRVSDLGSCACFALKRELPASPKSPLLWDFPTLGLLSRLKRI